MMHTPAHKAAGATLAYIGTKEITAWPQDGTGKAFPDKLEPGYAVKYPDGYISWSPKDVFEAAYRVTEGADQALTFGDALHFLKAGRRVTRGSGLVPGYECWLQVGSTGTPRVTFPSGNAYLWEPSVDELMANDWVVLP